MAALDSDSDEDLVSYGTGLEPLEEGAGYIRRQGLQTGWGSGFGAKHSALCQTFSGTGKKLAILALGAATRRRALCFRGAYISEGRIKGRRDRKMKDDNRFV